MSTRSENSDVESIVLTTHEFARQCACLLTYHFTVPLVSVCCNTRRVQSKVSTEQNLLLSFYSYTRHHYFFVDAAKIALYFFFSSSRFPILASQISPCSVHQPRYSTNHCDQHRWLITRYKTLQPSGWHSWYLFGCPWFECRLRPAVMTDAVFSCLK